MSNSLRMGNGHSSNRLHGLNGDRRPEIEPYKDLEEAKGDENPQGVHLVERNVAHDKGNERPKVAEGSCELHLVVVISPYAHYRYPNL